MQVIRRQKKKRLNYGKSGRTLFLFLFVFPLLAKKFSWMEFFFLLYNLTVGTRFEEGVLRTESFICYSYYHFRYIHIIIIAVVVILFYC